MTLIATIAAIALVAVGIGFAYTAATSNSGNSTDQQYITLIQGGAGEYKFANDARIIWNTDDSMEDSVRTTVFTFADTVDTRTLADSVEYKLVKVGNPFTLITTETNGNHQTPLPCTITCNDFTGSTGLSYFVEIKDDSEAIVDTFKINAAGTGINKYHSAAPAGWTDDAVFNIAYNTSSYHVYTATVYVGYAAESGGISKTHESGSQPAAPAVDLTEASLKFTLTANGSNGTPLESISADPTSLSVTAAEGVDHSKTATIAFTPIDATNQGLVAVSSDVGKATVTVNGSVIIVTGVAAGSATITVTSKADPSITATITVTVS